MFRLTLVYVVSILISAFLFDSKAANDAIGQTIIKSVEKTKKLDAVLQKSANGEL